MHLLLLIPILLLSFIASAQLNPEKLGYRHLTLQYEENEVYILIKSLPGEENKINPIIFFVQGSLPVPLLG